MTSLVIDAGMALALVLPLRTSERVAQLFEGWHARAVRFAVPALWGYEVVSGLRKAVSAGVLTAEEAETAVGELWAFNPEEIAATPERHRQALMWAEKLGQASAHDAQYLALAEELSLPYWTANRALAKRAQDVGAGWVRWIGSSE